MKEKKDRREIIAKAHNVTSAIQKKLAKNSKDDEKVDLANLAETLADRRDRVNTEEEK